MILHFSMGHVITSKAELEQALLLLNTSKHFINSQKELDKVLDEGQEDVVFVDSKEFIKITRPTSVKIIVVGTSVVKVSSPIKIVGRERAKITAHNDSEVWTYDTANAIMYDRTALMAMGTSSGTLYDDSKADTFDDSKVWMKDRSRLSAFNYSKIYPRGWTVDKCLINIYSSNVRIWTKGSLNNTKIKNLATVGAGGTIEKFLTHIY